MKLIDPIKKYLMDKNYVYEIDTTSNNKYSSISLIIRDIEDDIEDGNALDFIYSLIIIP